MNPVERAVAAAVGITSRRAKSASKKLRKSSPCPLRGEVVPGPERARLQLSHAREWVYCLHPDKPLGEAVCSCRGCGPTCPGYKTNARLDDNLPTDSVAPARIAKAREHSEVVEKHRTHRPARDHGAGEQSSAVGVVIGSYKWPALVELQIKLIRETCGPVPICVSSDHPETSAQVQAVCDRYPDVRHWPNPARIGHTGGDIAAFHKGAAWGKERGLRVVAKLSQRFLVTRPQWLQEGAADLLASGLSLATQRCRGTQRFDLRTEACLLDVATWSDPAILARIRPRKYWRDSPKGLTAETVIYRVLQDLAGEFFLPWNLFGEDRDAKYPSVVWHTSHPLAAYRQLAESHGLQLDPNFHVDGWQQDRHNGAYEYG